MPYDLGNRATRSGATPPECFSTMIDYFKTDRGALLLLLGTSALLLLFGLQARELWGAETRWANISLQMLQSGDYFDPYLLGSPYYDKPLPSYWLITLTAKLFGGLGNVSLRLSSVLGGWLSVWWVYALGARLFDKRTGLLAGWLLSTTFFFLVWARVATADVLTVCGVLAAVWWYWRGPEDTRVSRYLVFFLILSLTSLLKGLIGFILPALVLLPHLFSAGRWKRHLNVRLLPALVVAAALYMAPFVLSHWYGEPTYGESGLALVLRENVVRFFHPFDQFGPVWLYVAYLPIYTLPWAPCWLAGLWLALRNWKHTEPNLRWLILGLGLLFLFFTACGSRRSYYVLPLVPFAQLLGAWWLNRRLALRQAAGTPSDRCWAKGIGAAAVVLWLVFGVVYPWTNGGGGTPQFASDVRSAASRQAPWPEWQLVLIEVDNKLPMYLANQGAPFVYVHDGDDYPREGTSADLFAWLAKKYGRPFEPARTVIVEDMGDAKHVPLSYLQADHSTVVSRPNNGARWSHARGHESIAFIPYPAQVQAQASDGAL